METKDRWLMVLLLTLPLVLTLVFLGNNIDRLSVNSLNLLTGAAITVDSGTIILPDDFPIDDSTLNRSLSEDGSQPDYDSASEQNVGIAPIESSNPSSIGIQAEATSTSCGMVSSSLTLTSDVSNDTTCFTINANDLTLDCARFTAYYGATGTGYGVNNANGYDNITIKNCNLKKNSTSGSGNYGLFFNQSVNNTIYNNTIITNGTLNNYGIYFLFSDYSNISANTINATGTSAFNRGIYVTSSISNSINNNTISTDGSHSNIGISLSLSNYSNISANTIDTNGNQNRNKGVNLSSSISNIISSNTILTHGTNSNSGIELEGSSNSNNITHNTITANGTSSSIYGVYVSSSISNIIYNNTIYSNGTSSNVGVYLFTSSNATRVSSNTISTRGTSTDNYGIRLNTNSSHVESNTISTYGTSSNIGIYSDGGGLHNITKNIIDADGTGGGNRGMYIWSTVSSVINNNTITTNGTSSNEGIHLISSSNFNNISDNTINTSGTSSGNDGIQFSSYSHSNSLNGNRISTNGTGLNYALYFSGSDNNNVTSHNHSRSDDVYLEASHNNTFINIITSGSGVNETIAFVDTISSVIFKNYVVNFSVNTTNTYTMPTQRIYQQWFVIVNVSNETGDPISSVNITGFDVLGKKDDFRLSSGNGLASLEMTEFYIEDAVKYYLTQNSSARVIMENYSSNVTFFDLLNTTGRIINLTIHKFSCGDTLYSNFYTGSNTNCNTNWMNIGADNLTIYGNNHLISGQQTNSGLTIQNKRKLIAEYLQFNNFSTAVNLTFSNHSTFTNINITNSSIGVFFNTATNNTFFDSNIGNGSSAAVYATNTGETENCFINSTLNLNNVTVLGTAQVCTGWYTVVNVSFNGGVRLPNAHVYAYFNGTTELDASGITNSDGLVTLNLVDQVKNASGIFSKGPHNITVNFSLSSGTVSNFTSSNITGNSNVNLSLTLDCTAPYDGLTISNDTNLCPGTYVLGDADHDGTIIISTDSLTLTCDETVLSGSAGGYIGIYASGRSNITVTGCTVNDHVIGIDFFQTSNSVVNNSSVSDNTYGFYLFQADDNTISYSASTDNEDSGLYLYAADGNTIFNTTFDQNYYGIHINAYSYQSINNLVYFNSFTGNNNDIFKRYSDIDGFYSSPNKFNTTFNGVSVGNSYDGVCDINLTDSDGDGWYDSGSNYPYNHTTLSSGSPLGEPGLDYYPKVISCPSTVFLGSSSSSSSSSTTTSNPSAPPAPAAAPSTAVAAPAAVSSSVSPTTFTAGEAGAYQFNPNIDLTQYTDLITKLASYGYTPEEFIQQAIRILILDQQDFSLAYKQIYSLLGTFGKGKLSHFSGITILDSFSALAFSIENRQLDLDAGETINLDFTFDIPGTKAVKLPATVTFEGKDIKDVEMNVQPKSDSGVFIKLDQEKDLGEIIIVIAPNGESSALHEYTIEFSFIKKDEAETVFDRLKSILNLNEETHAADYIDGIKVKGNEGGLYGFDFKYDSSSMSGTYLFTSTILEGTTVIAQNMYNLELK
ncbi:right-handed parallel beta-helix repeat-containing protein [Candidatus Woesearchaeota archaeon]|nr:right-handed parallel beta-helix repeat-containing protein [Candidatus Woesearchaeota archaeon]